MKCFSLLGAICIFIGCCCEAKNQANLFEARRHVRVRAFLDVIAYAEGTYQFGRLGYSAHYPMRWFNGFSKHPGFVSIKKRSGKVAKYSASGRYMFLIKTWEYLAQRFAFKDFGPLNQDLAAIALLEEKGALKSVKNGQFEEAVRLANKTWATFPGSPYGQVTTTMPELRSFFNTRVSYYRSGGVL